MKCGYGNEKEKYQKTYLRAYFKLIKDKNDCASDTK